MKRTRTVPGAKQWPDHWRVALQWDVPEEIKLPRGTPRHLVSRQYEVTLKGAPSTWLLFDRYVYNPENGKEWVDAFFQGHYGGYTAFRPDRIVKVRKRVMPRKKKTLVETVDTNGAT